MKKGAIFDMDGLMFDTQKVYDEAWYALAPRFGITIPPAFIRDVMGTAGDRMRAIVNFYFPDIDQNALIEACYDRVRTAIETDLTVKPGLYELLDFFADRGVRTCVASGSRMAVIMQNLKTAGVEDRIGCVLSSAEGGIRSKPEPDIFLRAAALLELDPADCYVLEDSPGGTQAGLSAGCCTIMVPDSQEPGEDLLRAGAHVCGSLSEVLEKLKKGAL